MSLLEAFGLRVAEDGDPAENRREAYRKAARIVHEEYLKRAKEDNPHKRRRREIEARLRFYRDEYRNDVDSLIDLVFESEQVRKQRKRIAELAMSMNVTKSIIDTTSNLYDKPAHRWIDSDTAATAVLKEIEEREEFDELLPELQRLVNLCNEVLVWKGRGTSPQIITPDAFDVIPDPRNSLRVSAYLLDWVPMTHLQGQPRARMTHWKIWDDTVVIDIDEAGHMVRIEEHGLGEIPGLLVHRKKPLAKLLDADAGRDVLAAHKAVVLIELLIIRLAKSQGENQPVLKGDLARVASNQPMDGETPIGLPPGVDAEMLKSKTDPDHYLKVKRDVIGSIASTRGLSYEQVVLKTSPETGRQRLIEIRREQGKRWRRIEKKLVRFLGLDVDVTKLVTQFAELALKDDAREEFDLFVEKMPKGLDNPIDFLRRQNPDLSEEAAKELFARNIAINVEAFREMRALNMPADGDQGNLGKTPEENGRMGGRPSDHLRTIARRALMEAV